MFKVAQEKKLLVSNALHLQDTLQTGGSDIRHLAEYISEFADFHGTQELRAENLRKALLEMTEDAEDNDWHWDMNTVKLVWSEKSNHLHIVKCVRAEEPIDMGVGLQRREGMLAVYMRFHDGLLGDGRTFVFTAPDYGERDYNYLVNQIMQAMAFDYRCSFCGVLCEAHPDDMDEETICRACSFTEGATPCKFCKLTVGMFPGEVAHRQCVRKKLLSEGVQLF